MSGVKLRTRWPQNGAWFRPGVRLEGDADIVAYREEPSCPVGVVFRAADEVDAIRIANCTSSGLGFYGIAHNPEQADCVANALDTGMVPINSIDGEGVDMPSAEPSCQAFGREQGWAGIAAEACLRSFGLRNYCEDRQAR